MLQYATYTSVMWKLEKHTLRIDFFFRDVGETMHPAFECKHIFVIFFNVI